MNASERTGELAAENTGAARAARGTAPAVFVSSTIKDVEDLRGALRYWLQEQGFKVWLSEYNDMEKSPGANALDACFDTIRQADFYVLLIGDRRGSLYDSKEGVSVTQQEYRVAYEAFARQGHPIPVLFVRSAVKRLLEGWANSGAGGGPPFEDAPFVQRFIAEVTREQETTGALRGIGPYPLANWLHEFRDFGAISDALAVALSLRADVPVQRLLASIEVDLEFSLSALVGKHHYKFERGNPMREQLKHVLLRTGLGEEGIDRALDSVEVDWPFPHHWYLDSVTREVILDPDDMSPVELNREQTTRLSMYSVGFALPDNFSFNSVREAVHSGLLLRYDPEQRRFAETDLSLASIELLRAAEGYKGKYEMAQPVIEALMGPLATSNRLKQPRFSLSWWHAVIIWAMHHAEANLYRHAASLYAHLRGSKDSPLAESLLPGTPLGEEMEGRIQRERPSRVDIREWSKIPQFWNL